MKIFKKERGFTLIELMIVVAIIGILAAVAVPKFASMLEKAREGATKGNIGAIKSAVSIYYGDNQGAWPGAIDQGDTYFVNYLDRMPPVKVKAGHEQADGNMYPLPGDTNTVETTAEGSSTAVVFEMTGDGWRYRKTNGDVHVNSAQVDTGGRMYSNYGY